MSNVLNVSDAASIGLHTMVLLAGRPERVFSTKEIAERLGVSSAHLSKVLQRLNKAGLVRSTRGPGGGFSLKDNCENTSLLEVYESIDGPLADNRCLLGTPVCSGDGCIMGGLLESTNRDVREYLTSATLSDLSGVYERSEDGG